MTIQINKLLRAPLLKLVPEYADHELVREVELAREKALHNAYLNSRVA